MRPDPFFAFPFFAFPDPFFAFPFSPFNNET